MIIFTAVNVANAELCGSKKYPYSPHRRDWKFRGGGGITKTQNFKAMYEAKLEFPEGWVVIGQISSVGGMDIFWNHTLHVYLNFSQSSLKDGN